MFLVKPSIFRAYVGFQGVYPPKAENDDDDDDDDLPAIVIVLSGTSSPPPPPKKKQNTSQKKKNKTQNKTKTLGWWDLNPRAHSQSHPRRPAAKQSIFYISWSWGPTFGRIFLEPFLPRIATFRW